MTPALRCAPIRAMNTENVDYSRGGAPRRSFVQRLQRSVLVDSTVYEEVEHDESSMPQAAAVVALAALAGAIGAFAEVGFVRGLVQGFLLWGIGTGTVWLIGVLEFLSIIPQITSYRKKSAPIKESPTVQQSAV